MITEERLQEMKRIAELEAALRGTVSAMELQEKRQSVEFHISVEAFAPVWRAAIDRARAALSCSDAPEARPTQDNGGYDYVAALDAIGLSPKFFVVHPFFQAGRKAEKATPRLTDAEVIDLQTAAKRIALGMVGRRRAA